MKACNIINYHQRNKPFENWGGVKSCQPNKRQNKRTITKSY